MLEYYQGTAIDPLVFILFMNVVLDALEALTLPLVDGVKMVN